MYAQNRKGGKPNNLNFRSNKTKRPKQDKVLDNKQQSELTEADPTTASYFVLAFGFCYSRNL
jgi:hypothetical protein